MNGGIFLKISSARFMQIVRGPEFQRRFHEVTPVGHNAIMIVPTTCIYRVGSQMDRTPQPNDVVIQRIPTARLGRFVFFEEPMPMELAIQIRALRREHGLSYPEVMWALSETNPDSGQCHTFGQALTEQAFRLLKDPDDSWK